MSRETSRAWCTRENFAFSSPFAWRWSRDKRPDPNATRFDLSFNLVYLKIAKAASSTMGGVARRIAARHGLNGVSMFDEWIDDPTGPGEPGLWASHGSSALAALTPQDRALRRDLRSSLRSLRVRTTRGSLQRAPRDGGLSECMPACESDAARALQACCRRSTGLTRAYWHTSCARASFSRWCATRPRAACPHSITSV